MGFLIKLYFQVQNFMIRGLVVIHFFWKLYLHIRYELIEIGMSVEHAGGQNGTTLPVSQAVPL